MMGQLHIGTVKSVNQPDGVVEVLAPTLAGSELVKARPVIGWGSYENPAVNDTVVVATVGRAYFVLGRVETSLTREQAMAYVGRQGGEQPVLWSELKPLLETAFGFMDAATGHNHAAFGAPPVWPAGAADIVTGAAAIDADDPASKKTEINP